MKFSTEKLILRTLTENDAQSIFEIRSNTEINRFVHRVPPKNSLEALAFILNLKRKTENNEILFFGISTKNSSKLMGTICLWNFSEDSKTAELGYELLPEYHRKGMMTEAVHFILNYGFQELNLEKIDAFTNRNNLNSIKLLEKSKFIFNKNRCDEKYPENLIFEVKLM